MKPGYIYLILDNRRNVYEQIFVGKIAGVLIFRLLPFHCITDFKRTIHESSVKSFKEICAYSNMITESAYNEAVEDACK